MKVKVGKNVYLQKYDVAHILHDLNSIPATVMDEVFGDGEDGFFFMNDPTDAFRFESVFENPASVEWLMEQDWIVDYDEYSEMPLPELEALVERLRLKHDAGIVEFNARDEAYREKYFEEINDKFYKDSYKISSLGYLISARKGKVTFVFPDGYQGKPLPALLALPALPRRSRASSHGSLAVAPSNGRLF